MARGLRLVPWEWNLCGQRLSFGVSAHGNASLWLGQLTEPLSKEWKLELGKDTVHLLGKKEKKYCLRCPPMLKIQWASLKHNLIVIILHFLCRKTHCKILQLFPDHPAPRHTPWLYSILQNFCPCRQSPNHLKNLVSSVPQTLPFILMGQNAFEETEDIQAFLILCRLDFSLDFLQL